MIWCWSQTQYLFIKRCIDVPWHSYIFGGGVGWGVCVRNRILHEYPLETIYLTTRGFQTYITCFRSLDTFWKPLIVRWIVSNGYSCSILYIYSSADRTCQLWHTAMRKQHSVKFNYDAVESDSCKDDLYMLIRKCCWMFYLNELDDRQVIKMWIIDIDKWLS